MSHMRRERSPNKSRRRVGGCMMAEASGSCLNVGMRAVVKKVGRLPGSRSCEEVGPVPHGGGAGCRDVSDLRDTYAGILGFQPDCLSWRWWAELPAGVSPVSLGVVPCGLRVDRPWFSGGLRGQDLGGLDDTQPVSFFNQTNILLPGTERHPTASLNLGV